jgi:hypothetical protein
LGFEPPHGLRQKMVGVSHRIVVSVDDVLRRTVLQHLAATFGLIGLHVGRCAFEVSRAVVAHLVQHNHGACRRRARQAAALQFGQTLGSVFGQQTAAFSPPPAPTPALTGRSKLSKLWPWAVLLCLTLSWDASGADLLVMSWLGETQGFALRDHWWLASVMHDGGKRVALLIYAYILTMLFLPLGRWRNVARITPATPPGKPGSAPPWRGPTTGFLPGWQSQTRDWRREAPRLKSGL